MVGAMFDGLFCIYTLGMADCCLGLELILVVKVHFWTVGNLSLLASFLEGWLVLCLPAHTNTG